jgi:hypothetical protein
MYILYFKNLGAKIIIFPHNPPLFSTFFSEYFIKNYFLAHFSEKVQSFLKKKHYLCIVLGTIIEKWQRLQQRPLTLIRY